MRGLLEAHFDSPSKAKSCGDQNGDGVIDFVTTANSYSMDNLGYVIVFLGNPNIVTSIEKDENTTLNTFTLLQNYPNPFNPTTNIQYALGSRQNVTIKIYDILGKEILTLINNEEKDAGEYEIEFDASKYKLASGVYFCEIRTKDGYSNRLKMLYLK